MTSRKPPFILSDSISDGDVLTALPEAPLIRCDGPVIMVGGGAIDDAQLKALGRLYPIIAVDSGADVAIKLGLMPDVMIGDFDSASPDILEADIKQVHIIDQNSTDFEKALKVVSAPQIFGFGFLGKRMDHSLAALHAMAAYPEHNIVLIDPHDVVCMVRGQFASVLPQGIRLSLWPMTPLRFISSKGLAWPLDGLTIGPGQTLGTSNQVVIPPGDMETDIKVDIIPADTTPYAVLMPPTALKLILR